MGAMAARVIQTVINKMKKLLAVILKNYLIGDGNISTREVGVFYSCHT